MNIESYEPTVDLISDDELGELCERNGFPSVAEALAAGQAQQAATAYLVGVPIGTADNESGPYFYDDPEGHWLHDYIHALAADGDHHA